MTTTTAAYTVKNINTGFCYNGRGFQSLPEGEEVKRFGPEEIASAKIVLKYMFPGVVMEYACVGKQVELPRIG